jgi:hypothetical protein
MGVHAEFAVGRSRGVAELVSSFAVAGGTAGKQRLRVVVLGQQAKVERPSWCSSRASSIALGCYLLAFAAPVIALAATALTGKPLIALTLLLSAARAILDGLYEVSGSIGFE